MSRPKLLDVFAGAGGAGRGYELAGYDVTYIGEQLIEHV